MKMPIPKNQLNSSTGKSERQRFFKLLRAEAPEWLKEIWAASKRQGIERIRIQELFDGRQRDGTVSWKSWSGR